MYDQGLTTTSAVAGTVLEVRFEFLNDGDAAAENVGLQLDALDLSLKSIQLRASSLR